MTLRDGVFLFQLLERLVEFGSRVLVTITVNKHLCAGPHDFFNIAFGKNPFFSQNVYQCVEGIPRKGTLGHGFLSINFVFHNAVYGLTVTPTFRNDPSLTAKRQCEVCRKSCGERLNAFRKCRNCEQRAAWLKGQRAKVGAA